MVVMIVIQRLIDNAKEGDVIVIPPGIYYENIDLKGKKITLQSQNPSDPNVVQRTIIDGSKSNAPVVTCENNETDKTIIHGLTLRGGKGKVDYGEISHGGGIYIESAYPTIRDNIICGNTACEGNGGGITVIKGSPLIVGNSIIDNKGEWGAGVCLNRCTAILENNTIRGNSEAYCGGAIFIYESAARIVGNVLQNNTASYGSGIGLYGFIKEVYRDEYGDVIEDDFEFTHEAYFDRNGELHYRKKPEKQKQSPRTTIVGNSISEDRSREMKRYSGPTAIRLDKRANALINGNIIQGHFERGVDILGGNKVDIIANKIVSNKGYGISVGMVAEPVLIHDNIITDNGKGSIYSWGELRLGWNTLDLPSLIWDKNFYSVQKAMDFHVIGTTLHDRQSYARRLRVGDSVLLRTDTGNEMDKNLTAVIYEDKEIGLVPQTVSRRLNALGGSNSPYYCLVSQTNLDAQGNIVIQLSIYVIKESLDDYFLRDY